MPDLEATSKILLYPDNNKKPLKGVEQYIDTITLMFLISHSGEWMNYY